MISTVLGVLVLLNCAALGYEDYKSNLVSVGLLISYALLLLAFLLLADDSFGVEKLLVSSISPIILCSILYVYCRLRFGRKNFFKEVFGLGDVIFLTVSSWLFSPFGFTIFLTFASSLALVANLSLLKSKDKHAIPFIFYLAVVFCFFLIFGIVKKEEISYLPVLNF